MHISEDDLAIYAADPEAVVARETVEAHIAVCAECADVVQSYQRLCAAFRSETAWATVDDRAYAITHRRLRAYFAATVEEDARAKELIEPLIGNDVLFVWEDLPRKEQYRFAGAVRFLSAAAQEWCERDPAHALNIADVAIGIAEQIDVGAYPGETVVSLRGTAWKERGNALRYLGRWEDALTAFDHAEQTFRELTSSVLELSSVEYGRATVYVKSERLELALECAARAAKGFLAVEDRGRWIAARMVEGNALLRQARFAEARVVFADLLESSVANPLLRTRLNHAIGDCDVRLHRFDDAIPRLLTVLAEYQRLGVETEALRVRRILAEKDLAVGEYRAALAELRFLLQEHQARSMALDAAMVWLDMSEALLALGELAEIIATGPAVSRTFLDAGMYNSALGAIAAVVTAARRRYLTMDYLSHVRAFFSRLADNPTLIYAEPG